MAAVATGRRSLIGHALSALEARSRARDRRPSRLAAAVQSHLGTFLACAAAVADGFLHGPTVGLAVLVPAILVLDYKIQG